MLTAMRDGEELHTEFWEWFEPIGL